MKVIPETPGKWIDVGNINTLDR